MSKFGVSQRKIINLEKKMERFNIKEKDIEENFIRPSGKGGRKADSTSNCVYLKHLPTKIEVKCHQNRSRTVNRFLARRRLVDKIANKILGKKSKKQQEIEKIRRKKRRRSKRAKEKMLKKKKEHAEKKKLRKKIDLEQELGE